MKKAINDHKARIALVAALALVGILLANMPCAENATAQQYIQSDRIAEKDTRVETVDTGDGHISVVEDGAEVARFTGNDFDNYDGDGLNFGDIALDSISADGGVEVVVNEAGNDEDFRVEATGGITDALFVEGSSGRVGIGTTGPDFQLNISSDSAATFGVDEYVNSASGPVWDLRKARGTEASPIIVQDDDTLGNLTFRGHDGTDFENAVGIIAQVDGTPSDGEDMPGRLVFFTRADGASSWGERMRIDKDGNVGIGTMGPLNTASVSGTLAVGNGAVAQMAGTYGIVMSTATTTPTMPAGNAGFFVADTDGSAEMWVIDEADNATQLSPHGFPLFDPDPSLEYPWSYYSCNAVLGLCINVDIAGLVAWAEEHSGQTFVYMQTIATVDWDTQQAEIGTAVNAQRLAEAAAVEMEQVDAVEVYTPTVTIETGEYITETTSTYSLDTETGETITTTTVVTTAVTIEVDGAPEWRLKSGCRLDADTGMYWCATGEEDAEYEEYVPAIMPDWMRLRMNEQQAPP